MTVPARPAAPALSITAAPTARSAAPGAEPPAALRLLLTSEISPTGLSVHGDGHVRTPHLDRLAARGRIRDQAYLTTASCSLSRRSIVTGRDPHDTAAPAPHTRLPDGRRTFGQARREIGDHTVLSDKNHTADADRLAPGGSEK